MPMSFYLPGSLELRIDWFGVTEPVHRLDDPLRDDNIPLTGELLPEDWSELKSLFSFDSLSFRARKVIHRGVRGGHFTCLDEVTAKSLNEIKGCGPVTIKEILEWRRQRAGSMRDQGKLSLIQEGSADEGF